MPFHLEFPPLITVDSSWKGQLTLSVRISVSPSTVTLTSVWMRPGVNGLCCLVEVDVNLEVKLSADKCYFIQSCPNSCFFEL